jgi:hypothetical protein
MTYCGGGISYNHHALWHFAADMADFLLSAIVFPQLSFAIETGKKIFC